MEILSNFLDNLLILANAMSFYILLGLLIAGVLKQLIPNDFISSHLGKNKTSSVIKATLFGIPMPVCSCSVIPLAKSLQKEGANKGAVQSFLISTPITGVDSIMATYSFFGWFFTIYRVATSMVIAITTGLLQNYVDKKDTMITKDKTKPLFSTQKSSCCSNITQNLAPIKKVSSCCSVKKDKKFSIKNSFIYAYGTLFKDIYFSLAIGLIIGALFTTLLPKEIIAPLFEYQFLTYLVVLIIAMPLYVCATASLPIAAAFMLSGMSSGAAFVFLSAGPATNSITMGVVASMFGKKSLFIYIGTISILSIFFGYIFDEFFDSIEVMSFETHGEHMSIVDMTSTAIMFGLILYYIIKKQKESACTNVK